ncbi:MAG: dTMP kinase [Myxococcota bacterium]
MHEPTVNSGTFIVFEGLDGAGKSTQVERLAERLRAGGHSVCRTREPTDGAAGAKIRALSAAGADLTPQEELALFVEDRAEHARTCLLPELAAGHVVICDRYYLSTVAYQGARGLDPREILERSERDFPVPDLVLLLCIDPAQGLARVAARGDARNLAFEQRTFLERADAVFRGLERDYLVRIDASAPPDDVERAVVDAVRRHTGLRVD